MTRCILFRRGLFVRGVLVSVPELALGRVIVLW